METHRLGIPLHTSSQSSGGGSLARGVDGDGRDLLDELEQLRLGRSGVPEHEDVDVATEAHAVGQHLLRSTEQQAGDRFLDVCVVDEYQR